jgi:large subunit ribosomal protein L17
MKKRKYGRKLSRGRGARKALFRSLVRSLTEHGVIVTTKAKAKSIQPEIDKLVSVAKSGGVVARRRVYAKLGNDRKTTDTIFTQVAPLFKDRTGGFTRIVKTLDRRGDMAKMVRLEWVEDIGMVTKGTREEKNKDKKKQSKLRAVAKKATKGKPKSSKSKSKSE